MKVFTILIRSSKTCVQVIVEDINHVITEKQWFRIKEEFDSSYGSNNWCIINVLNIQDE